MLPQLVSRRAVCRSSGLQASYVEISRFVRTRRHGITLPQPKLAGTAVRCLSSSHARLQIQPSETLRKTLDKYAATIHEEYAATPFAINPTINKKVGEQVSLVGYLGTRRDVSKKLTFALLRNPNQSYCIQLISTPKEAANKDPEAHAIIKSLRDWTPVKVTGTLKQRNQPSKESTAMGIQLINDTEMEVSSVETLNEIPSDLWLNDESVFPPEQRHLQLRTNDELRNNLVFRHQVTKAARSVLGERNFVEVETPILFKSTPEGAREFLVPTRTKGLAYALPQSPQQYKQILMASGITKYYQFARCFRDEDLRADRQPEFTQLDMELSFQAEGDVMKEIETLLQRLWSECLGQEITAPFQRMTYHDAMAKYGSDKPDLRLGMEIQPITDRLPQNLISMISDLPSPAVDAFKFKLSDDPKITKKFITSFLDSPEGKLFLDNPAGQPGVFVADESKPQQGLGALGFDFVMNSPEELAVEHGDLLILQARPNEPFSGGSTPLGNLRLALHKAAVAQGLIEKPKGFRFLWIKDFPLFTPSNDVDPGQGGSAGFSATHHPFTAPKTAADVELLLSAPEKVTAAHYDIVVNGVELGGGSRRIHNAEVQEFILRDVLKMSAERLEDFRHLLDVLRSGCPPHAGIALGWDRLVTVMLGKESVRDVIAFPKSGRGEDMLVKSPNAMTKEQLATYHLRLKE